MRPWIDVGDARNACNLSPCQAQVTHCCANGGAAGTAAGAAGTAAGAAAGAAPSPLEITCSVGALSPRISLTSCTGGLLECTVCACLVMLSVLGTPTGEVRAAGDVGTPAPCEKQRRHRSHVRVAQAVRHKQSGCRTQKAPCTWCLAADRKRNPPLGKHREPCYIHEAAVAGSRRLPLAPSCFS